MLVFRNDNINIGIDSSVVSLIYMAKLEVLDQTLPFHAADLGLRLLQSRFWWQTTVTPEKHLVLAQSCGQVHESC